MLDLLFHWARLVSRNRVEPRIVHSGGAREPDHSVRRSMAALTLLKVKQLACETVCGFEAENARNGPRMRCSSI